MDKVPTGILSTLLKESYVIYLPEETAAHEIFGLQDSCGPLIHVRNGLVSNVRMRSYIIHVIKGSQEDMMLKLKYGMKLMPY